MDNFALDVRARSRESFGHAIAIAFAHAPGGKARFWCEHPKYGLVLFWSDNDTKKFNGKPIIPLPFEMDIRTGADFLWNWLQKVDREKFELKDWDRAYDDGDVHNEHAWHVYVENWGHIGDSPYAVVAVMPAWAWLGK